jgi:hypothetical protein
LALGRVAGPAVRRVGAAESPTGSLVVSVLSTEPLTTVASKTAAMWPLPSLWPRGWAMVKLPPFKEKQSHSATGALERTQVYWSVISGERCVGASGWACACIRGETAATARVARARVKRFRFVTLRYLTVICTVVLC